MDLEISPGDIDRINTKGVPSKGKKRPIIAEFVDIWTGGAYLPTKKD